MDTAIKRAKILKYGLLGMTLATAIYITQTTSFLSSTAALDTKHKAVQVLGFDAPIVSNLWSDYDTLFLEQEEAINQTFTEVDTMSVEIDSLVAAIDQDMANFLAGDVRFDATSTPIRLGFVAPL